MSAPFAQAQHNTAQDLVVLTAADPNASHGMAITLADVTGTGTYALEDGFPLRFAVVTLGSAQGWGTTDGGGGTLTISSFTSQRIQGTFSFTAVPAPNSSQSVNLSVTNGQFDLPVTIVQ